LGISFFLFKLFFIVFVTGNYGGVRAATLLRPFLSELGTVTIPAQASLPLVHKNISESGEPSEVKWRDTVARVVNELEWYADALKAQKASKNPPT
jgi:NAD(P)H-dependent FMN reductase